ncbi:hypothetical protein RQP46_003203 [Phenoliferia psychrophenolica]
MATTQRYPVKNSELPPGTWRSPTHAEGEWLADEDERPPPESMFDSEFEEQPDVQAALLSIFARPDGELVGPSGSRQSRKRAGPADGLDDDERERRLFCATIGMADTKISSSEAKRATPPQIHNLKMRWPKGCIRLTRTLGRENNPNTILLSDVIDPSALLSIWLNCFDINPSTVFPLLPLRGLNPHGLRKVPCFIGQDLKQDRAAILYPPDPNSEAIHDQIAHELVKAYADLYGKNYHAIYPKGGLAHSKILLAVYPSFLRLWIGSANLHGFDTTQSDNHWFVQDLPLLAQPRRGPKPPQESDILAHAASLGCPDSFLSSIKRKYDWSEVKFHVVTSVPRTVSKLELGKYGAFRLRNIARSILSKEETRNATIESCSASLGRLKSTWLDTMRHLLVGGHKRFAPQRYQPYLTRSRSSRRSSGKTSLDGEDEDRDQAQTKSRRGMRAPALKIVYPNQAYVENSASFQMRMDSRNMGAHIDWDHAAASTQGFFHDYVSNGTPGTHLHQKFLLCLPPDARPSTLPHFAYLGSHNFSAGAWGEMWLDKNKKWHNKMANWEIGLVFAGKHLAGLVEGGDWEQIVTYERPPRPYGDRRPFQWGKGKESEA